MIQDYAVLPMLRVHLHCHIGVMISQHDRHNKGDITKTDTDGVCIYVCMCVCVCLCTCVLCPWHIYTMKVQLLLCNNSFTDLL